MQELFEAAPSRVVASRLYWHGTNNAAGQKVFRDGFVVGAMRPRGANYLAPLLPGIYMTPRPEYALNFAKWDNRQTYGWLFACYGSNLINVEIDEDEVGIALKTALRLEEMPGWKPMPYDNEFEKAKAAPYHNPALRSHLLDLARKHLSADDLKNLRSRNHPGETARAGAALVAHMSPEMKLYLIDLGCHIAHSENLIPDMAWRFSPKDTVKINNEMVIPGQSPVEVLDRLAERMR